MSGDDQLSEQLDAYRDAFNAELARAAGWAKVWASNERHPWTSDPVKDARDALRAYLARGNA